MDGLEQIWKLQEEVSKAEALLEEAIEEYSKGFSHREDLVQITTKSGNYYKATILHNDNLELIKALIYEENIEALVNLTEDRMCLVIGR